MSEARPPAMTALPWPPADPVLLLPGDARTQLARLPAGVVQCVVTSPPYWSLRDYQCAGQIGLEATVEAWVAALVAVFREVRRVLRPDGTLFLNVGDAYSQDGKWGGASGGKNGHSSAGGFDRNRKSKQSGLGPKQLLGLPWRLAFALQADGWVLRSEIIWAKRNPLPESVTDRPTKAHEQIFLFARQPAYFYDAAAIREEQSALTLERFASGNARRQGGKFAAADNGVKAFESPEAILPAGRNARDVWALASESFAGAHFATFPSAIPHRAILAGTSAKGQCPACGAPWRRVVDRRQGATGEAMQRPKAPGLIATGMSTNGTGTSTLSLSGGSAGWRDRGSTAATTGWAPSCRCGCPDVEPQIVLDPFAGSGTTLAEARRLGRRAVGVELNPAYLALATARIAAATPGQTVTAPGEVWGMAPLFAEVP